MPRLSIVVLNWNVAGMLAACLESLPGAAAEWWSDTEVIVVDNASSDGSVEMVGERFPGARLLVLPRNMGFSGGNNEGIRVARGECILLLNPDTVAHPGSIATLADYIQAHPGVGITGPRLLNPDGTLQPSRRRFPTLLTALVESTPLQRTFPHAKVLRDFYMLDRPDDETQPVGWLSGAALMCRRETLGQAGWFDPGYFMFSEEMDLCRRVNDAGWSVVYVPTAEIVHYGGGSTGQDVPARHVHFNTSKARYFRLHEGRLAGTIVRRYLLALYLLQLISEAAKWLLGHKRTLRAERVRLYIQVLRSGLREHGAARGRGDGVLLITGEYPPARGGVGDYTCKLGVALEEAGVRVDVLAEGNRELEASTDSPFPIPGSSPFITSKISVSSALRALRGSRARVAQVQYQTGAYGMRPTVNMLPLLLRLARGWRGATVVTFHDLRVPYLFPKAGPVRDWANRLLALSAGAAIATNEEDAARLRSWGVRRVRLIPIGSNIPDSPPPGYNRDTWRAERGVRPATVLLAYFGFLNSTKGLDDLLHALASLREHGDFRLVMVGGGLGSSDPTNRDTAAQLDTLARELGVHGRLIWTGYLPPHEVSAALHAADMAVLPYADGASFRRGSLLAVLEHGAAVVTTLGMRDAAKGQRDRGTKGREEDEGDQAARLVHGENCLLVEAGDRDALVGAVRLLAGDAELREKLGGGALRLAGCFSWQHIARLHARLYEEVAKDR
jgi:GT2 family glycosyltransferase/glycosyltransferase involved in cell wall biosynthesis